MSKVLLGVKSGVIVITYMQMSRSIKKYCVCWNRHAYLINVVPWTSVGNFE
jgi:hypothetical protein